MLTILQDVVQTVLIFIIYPLILVGSIPASLYGFFWVYNRMFHPRDTFGQEK